MALISGGFEERSCYGRSGRAAPRWRLDAPKKTGARSARVQSVAKMKVLCAKKLREYMKVGQ